MRVATLSLLVLTTFAFGGCLDNRACPERPAAETGEPSSKDYALCGTVLRWDGGFDSLEIVATGSHLRAWDQIEVHTTRLAAEADASIMVHAAEGRQPTVRSPGVDFRVHKFSEFSEGTPSPGDKVYFCRERPQTQSAFWLRFALTVEEGAGRSESSSADVPVLLDAC